MIQSGEKETDNTKKNTYSHEMAFGNVIDPFLLLTGWDLYQIGRQFRSESWINTFLLYLLLKDLRKPKHVY